jgi:hypothetical protein
MLAAADEAADTDRVADLEAFHVRADRADVADDLVARHAGIPRAAPFRARRVQVGVADAAIGDLDLHVACAGRAALDVDGFERFVGGVRAVGFGRHGLSLGSRGGGADRPQRAAGCSNCGRRGGFPVSREW